MPAWNVALWLLVVGIAAPVAVWVIECAAALLLPVNLTRHANGMRPTVTLLIPAHNEADGIQQTLESVFPQLGAGDRVLVIADNCTDNTASIARQCGADVVERCDPARRGKSFALEFGMQRVNDHPTDVVMVIDADCVAEKGAIRNLALMASRTGRPVQAAYYLEPPAAGKPQVRITALAFYIRNVVRSGGLARLGCPCFLNGSGMAFPGHIARSVDWANRKIAEDKWTTVDMALSGHLPLFCEDSRITSRLPGLTRAQLTQQTRWMHGNLETMLGQAPRLIAGAVRQLRPGLLVLALDLLVPPFSLLILLWLAGLGIAGIAGVARGVWGPADVLAICGLFMMAVVAAIAARFDNRGTWRLFAAAPRSLYSRMRLLGMFVLRRQRLWIPTRDREGPNEE